MNEMILETEDLRLRPTELEDLELFFAWERDPDVTRFFSIGDDQSREEVYCKYFNDLQDNAVRQFTICLKGYDADTVIGRVVISDIIEGWKAEIWRIYIGDTNLRGNGYGRQAMEAMLKYCFTELSLERLYLDHYTGNPARQLYLKLGFKPEGCLRKNCRKNGVLYDVHLLSMLREEYLSLNL